MTCAAIIDALARALRLSQAEHTHLRVLARNGNRSIFARGVVPAAIRCLVDSLIHVTGRRWPHSFRCSLDFLSSRFLGLGWCGIVESCFADTHGSREFGFSLILFIFVLLTSTAIYSKLPSGTKLTVTTASAELFLKY